MNRSTYQFRLDIACIISFSLLLGACSGQQKLADDLQEYQQRLASVLNVPSQVLQEPTLPPFPSIKHLKKDIPTTTIKLAEFYALKDCQLSTLVAQRNTALGRTQFPSARYQYEVELLTEIQRCLTISEQTEISATLKSWQQQKQNNLPLVWANLFQTSDEVKLALSANSGFILGTDKDGINQTAQAFEYLLQLLSKPQANLSRLEKHLEDLKNYQLPAKIWRSQLILTNNLNQITTWLEHNIELMQCPTGKPSKQVEYISNVFQLFFVEKIQPVASNLNHYQYQLNPIFESLATIAEINTLIKDLLLSHSQQNFEHYQQAIKEHIEFWQKLYKRCGISPNG